MVPASNGPVYEGIFNNICSLFPSPYFPIIIVMEKVWNKKFKFSIKGECERNKGMRFMKSLHKLSHDMNVSKYHLRYQNI